MAGQQPPRVAGVCVQLALSRRVEWQPRAAPGLDWPRCNALRDGVGLGGRCRMALEPSRRAPGRKRQVTDLRKLALPWCSYKRRRRGG